MSKRKRNGGFSIVEVVVALSIIIAVSVASLSITFSAGLARIKAINKSEAQGFAENSLECFKASDSYRNFTDNILFAEGLSPIGEPEVIDGKSIYVFNSEKNKFTATVTVFFAENAGERPQISVNVTDNDGKDIISYSYIKGDGYDA